MATSSAEAVPPLQLTPIRAHHSSTAASSASPAAATVTTAVSYLLLPPGATASPLPPPLPLHSPPHLPEVFGQSESSDGLDADNSAASNNTTTQSPLPQSAIALQPPSFQELPPLPPALQHPISPDDHGEHEDDTMGATAKPDSVTTSTGASKSENLKNSIGHLKQEMKSLRNADLTLLYQLNELHQQILAYKVAMSERLERQSETNSEYSNSLAEDFEEDDEDFDDEEDDEEDEDVELRHPRRETFAHSLVPNGDSRDGGRNIIHHPVRLQQQQQSPSSPQTTTHRVPAPATTTPPTNSSSTSRSLLHQLRQQLPPPPPRPGADAAAEGAKASGEDASASVGVHHWLDLNFQPDSYNC